VATTFGVNSGVTPEIQNQFAMAATNHWELS